LVLARRAGDGASTRLLASYLLPYTRVWNLKLKRGGECEGRGRRRLGEGSARSRRSDAACDMVLTAASLASRARARPLWQPRALASSRETELARRHRAGSCTWSMEGGR
jgi:hypothetical protein